jgi:hypothetical protein
MTGFVNTTGSEPTTVCSDAPVAGAMKSCLQLAQFGRYERMTREMEVNAIGQQVNRGEFMDLTIVNDPLMDSLGILNPGVGGNPSLAREVLVRFMEVGIAFQNILMPQVFTGNPANNSAGGGYKEFPGLDILIGTSKVDAMSGQSCPSLYSDVRNFAYARVDTLANDVVGNMVDMYRNVRDIANRTNLGPCTWAWVMKPQLFEELTAVWPCWYLTSRCTVPTGSVNTVMAADQIAMRDAMRAGNYLLMDGQQVPVIIDDAIIEESHDDVDGIPAGCFASDVYLIPLTYLGNRAATFWEYFNYNGPNAAMQGVQDGNLTDDFWTDSGIYLWHKKPPLNWCVQWIAKVEPRIILLTPHIAGRLTNVVYCPIKHRREVLPTQDYFVDGGVTSRPGPSFYAEWTNHPRGQ